MIKESLFAAEEREAKLDKLGDILQVLEKHVDFGALAKAIDEAAPRPSPEKGGARHSRQKSWCERWCFNSFTV